jgi:phytoene dehydrogenase-like protein
MEEGGELIMPIGQKVALIGGGHNALIAAFYLAKGGFRPVVLERRSMVGGGAVTEEFYPGFKASTLAHTLGPLRADIAREMQLDRFNLQIFRPDPRVFAPEPGGRGLLFYDDAAKTAGAISHLSAKDGAKYTEFAKQLEKIAGVFRQIAAITPPRGTTPGKTGHAGPAAVGSDGCGGFCCGIL